MEAFEMRTKNSLLLTSFIHYPLQVSIFQTQCVCHITAIVKVIYATNNAIEPSLVLNYC